MRNVLVVDDHPIVLEVMGAMAHAVFPAAAIWRAGSFEEAAAAAAAVDGLDLALIDLGLPGCSGIEALSRFRELVPEVTAVVISANEEPSVVVAALEAGARGYIPKTSKPDVISAALRLVAAGGVYVPPQALGDAAASSAPRSSALTDRQLEVLRLITQGLANKEIAKQLRIARETVKQHAKAVYAALGIASRSQAARAAERRGIKL